jgi:hypothetical protein
MRVSANMLLHEKLDYIALGSTLEDQCGRAKEVAKLDPTFVTMMRMASVEDERIVGLPEGMPETYKPETDMPEGISHTTARQELRRFKNFYKLGSMQSIPQHRRETIWVQMLEGLHWKEAQLIVAIKDWKLFVFYPNMYEVLSTLGVKIDAPNPKSDKSSVPKKTTKKIKS